MTNKWAEGEEKKRMNTNVERTSDGGVEPELPQADVAVGVGHAKLVAVLAEPHPRHLRVSARRPRLRDRVRVVPLPQVHRPVL